VRKHILPGIKPKDPRAYFIAVNDATLGSCEDNAGNIPIEQRTITLSPQARFFRNDRVLPTNKTIATNLKYRTRGSSSAEEFVKKIERSTRLPST
jgi:hypothetical protein